MKFNFSMSFLELVMIPVAAVLVCGLFLFLGIGVNGILLLDLPQDESFWSYFIHISLGCAFFHVFFFLIYGVELLALKLRDSRF